MNEPFSPAAQAVLDAAVKAQYGSCYTQFGGIAAAALRAAVNRVVPEDCLEHFPNDSAWQGGFTDANERIRLELLAIAAELESQ